jgi:hypothetical protein
MPRHPRPRGPRRDLGPADLRPTDWPRLMVARTAAAYCDERSVEAFRRAVGKLWPQPKRLAGKGERWLREDLDQAIDQLMHKGGVRDLADVL